MLAAYGMEHYCFSKTYFKDKGLNMKLSSIEPGSDAPKIVFPCEDYVIKIIGDASDEMTDFALTVTEAHAPGFDRSKIRIRPSGKGRFQSITLYITAQGEEHLRTYHQALIANAMIKKPFYNITSMYQTRHPADPIVRDLGVTDYAHTWQAMSDFTNNRQDDTPDELWLLEHEPTFTQGQAGKPEHILNPGQIPIVQSDRGGQVTYHGPGQLIVYPLINLKHRKLNVRKMVSLLENSIIELLSLYDIQSYAKADAPGVYVQQANNDAKIASLGLRVRRGCCFHGASINIDMDLAPFQCINPCGYEGMLMTQIANISQQTLDITLIKQQMTHIIFRQLTTVDIT